MSKRLVTIISDRLYSHILELNTYQNVRKRTTIADTVRMMLNTGYTNLLDNKQTLSKVNTIYNRKKINDSFDLFDSIEKEKENK